MQSSQELGMKLASREEYLELYKIVRSGQQSWANQHLQYLFQFVVAIGVFTTIAGAILQATTNQNPGLLKWILIFIGLINIVFSFAGICICNRAYQRFLEEISICSKLEEYLGFVARPDNFSTFANETTIIPTRWLEGTRKAKTAKEFVDSKLYQGVNRIGTILFALLILFNFAGITAIWFFVK